MQVSRDFPSSDRTWKRQKRLDMTPETVLQKGDMIYLTTDGFSDQNNTERIKFGTSRLLDIIKNTATQSPEIQNNVLTKELETWMQNSMQRDDITVFGIKI